jgi:tRNA1Val (adenine37-N6)-methyltransferase
MVPILLATFHPGLELVGVEIQPRLVAAARRNVAANGLADSITIREQDIRTITGASPPGQFSQVLSNPPYYKLHTGRVNPSTEKAVARHEICLTLQELAKAASGLLEKHGTLSLVFIPERLPELLEEMEAHHIAPNRLRFVHSYADTGATLALAAGEKGARGAMTVEPPLIIYRERGIYTAEVEALYKRGAAVRCSDA